MSMNASTASDPPAAPSTEPHPSERFWRWVGGVWAPIWKLLEQWTDRADRLWGRAVTGCPPGSARDAFVSLAVVMFLVLNAARSEVDAALQRINPAGENGVGVSALHDGSAAIRDAFRVWEAGRERLSLFIEVDPVMLAWVHTVIDVAALPFAAALLFGFSRHIRAQLADEPGRDVLTAAMLGAIGYLVLGVVNQVLELVILGEREPVAVATQVLQVTGRARPLVLVMVLVPSLAGLIRVEYRKPAGDRIPWWRGAPTYRIMIAVAALHAVLLLVSVPGKQSADAMRLWEVRPSLGLWGHLATAVLSVSLALYATRMGSRVVPSRVVLEVQHTRRLVEFGAGVAVVGGVAWLASWSWAPFTLAVGVLTAAIGVLSLPLVNEQVVRPTTMKEVPRSTKVTVPAILAAAPFATLAVALVGAAVPTMLDVSTAVEEQTEARLIFWAALATVLAIGAYPVVRVIAAVEIDRRAADRIRISAEVGKQRWSAHDLRSRHDDRFRGYALAVFAPSLAMALWIVIDPVERGPDIGVIAIMVGFLLLFVSLFGALAVSFDGRALPAALDFVGIRRVPILTGLIVIGVLSQYIAGGGYHDVSVTPEVARPAVSQLTIDDAFASWVDTHVDAGDTPGSTGSERPAVPLVFVTAAGGGIKAAAFTARVLDCVFAPVVTSAPEREAVCADTSTWDRVFVASGASGGSVGIAAVLAETKVGGSDQDWVGDRLGGDLLSASIAWQLLVEAPNAVAAFHPGRDRAAILEAAWRQRFGIEADTLPFFTDRSDAGWQGPLPFLSGTNLVDGCRVNVSPVRAGVARPQVVDDGDDAVVTTNSRPCTSRRIGSDAGDDQLPDQGDTRDLTDYLCDGRTVDIATAAFLSARFPYVSPTGTLTCNGDEISIGDGGYRDNSGARTVAELWDVLEPFVVDHNRNAATCVVPIVLEINSGYAGLEAPSQGSSAAQFLSPALGAKSVFGDLSFGPVEQVAAEFRRTLAPDLEATFRGDPLARHFRVSLLAHPGVTAPLGWSLSEAAVDDFGRQLVVEENREVIEELTSILTAPEGLACRSVEER